MIKKLYLILCAVSFCLAACPYEIKNLQFKQCDKKEGIKVENITAYLDNDCNLRLGGCIHVIQPLKTITSADITYKAFKENIPLITGKEKGCGFKHEDLNVKCPFDAPAKFCLKPSWKISLPQQAIGMMLGRLKGQVTGNINMNTKYCYEGSAELKKKK